jgi:general secretion pathway protein A
MVFDRYKLRENPFGVTPDSRYLFLSATHREALASLLYGIEAGRGFIALIAMPGMGKTTLLFDALKRLGNRSTTVFLFQTICTPEELLRALLSDLGILDIPETLIEMQFRLNEVLTKQSRSGKRLVVVIDEAQNLNDPVLELVRMLSNFETQQEKLIQIILAGQPQLADKLSSTKLVQLRQRVSIFARLEPFSPEETALYIDHRMRMAGYDVFDPPLFTADALALIAQASEGIPRNINNLCFNALSLGCALKRQRIDCDIVREVVADLNLEPLRERQPLPSRPAEGGEKGVRAFPCTASAPSDFTNWLPKIAIAIAILLIASGALVINTAARPFAHAESSPPSMDPTPQRVQQAGAIRVSPKQNLSRICAERFGSCSPELLREIHELNPWMTNPDHIESGQVIRIPIDSKSSGNTQMAVNQVATNSPSKRGMQ